MAFMGIFIMWLVVFLIILGISLVVCLTCFIVSAIIMKVKRRKSPGEKVKQPWYVIVLRIIGVLAAIPLILCAILFAYAGIMNSIDKKTNLIRAASKHDYVRVEKILQKGADVDKRDVHGNTLLMCIVANDDYETKEPNWQYRFNIFNEETDEKNQKLVQLLLQYGANINAKKKSCGIISEHMASDDLYSEINTYKEHSCGNTVLIEAVKYGTSDMVNLLIENGADVNEANECGFTPLLMCATERTDKDGGAEILKLLLDAGANPSAISNFNQDAIELLNCDQNNANEKKEKMEQQLNERLHK